MKPNKQGNKSEHMLLMKQMKTGLLRELYERQLITQSELQRLLQILNGNKP
jgi:hypothetical protein